MSKLATVAPDAKRNWLRSHWKALLIATVLFLIGVGIGAAGVSKKTSTKTVAGPIVKHTITVTKKVPVRHVVYRKRVVTREVRVTAPAPTPTPPPTPSGPSDKDFAVETLQIQDDGLGDIGGIARITNTASNPLTGIFTFTFFQGGQVVGTAQASAQSVGPGQTVTVQLVSQDSMISGSFRYQFQVDSEG
jgi:hypothetical protein